jgi:hypothetical protein
VVKPDILSVAEFLDIQTSNTSNVEHLRDYKVLIFPTSPAIRALLLIGTSSIELV